MSIDIPEINMMAARIGRYPVSAEELASLAQSMLLSPDVVDFFEAMPAGTAFKDHKSLMVQAYESGWLENELEVEPEERLHSYD